MKLVLTTLLFLIISCQDEHVVGNRNGLHFVKDVQMKMENVKHVDWDIGKEREATISKGIRLYVTLPKIDEDGEEILQNKYGINSYIFRFSRLRKGRIEAIGHYYFLFKNMTRNTKNFSVSLFYQAASVSKGFRNFHCPAFDHRYEIENFEIKKRSSAKKENIFVRLVERMRGQVGQLRFAPTVLPGGLSLLGDYYVDMALYSTRNKQRYSNWHKAAGGLNISRETKRNVQSCIGVKEENNPLPKSRIPNIRDLEIK
jgi:hypothetical protein